MKYFWFFLFLLFLPVNCKKDLTPEEKIKTQLEQIRESAEQKKIGRIMDFIAPDYEDKYHNRRDNIKAILIQNLMFRKAVKIAFKDIDIRVDGDSSVVSLKLFVREQEGLIPDNADFMKIVLRLSLRDDKWVITDAEWVGHQSPF